MEQAPQAVVLDLVSRLDTLGLAYAVGGSVASSLVGEPRTTNDVDLVVYLPESRLAAFLAAVRPAYYVADEAAQRAVRTRTSFNLLHFGSALKLDLFVAGDGPLDRAQLERARLVALTPGGPLLRVTSAEVLVLRKLAWYASGAGVSDRQWRDVLGILRVQGQRLDRTEVRALASRCGLTELVERALREVGD